MTVEWAEIPYPVLRRISERIIAEVPHVNRVVYDITSTPSGTIERVWKRSGIIFFSNKNRDMVCELW